MPLGVVALLALSAGSQAQAAADQMVVDYRFISADRLAEATVQPSDLPEGAVCAVELSEQSVSGSLVLVAGAYALVCRDSNGKVLADFQAPIEWKFQPGDRMDGLINPEVRGSGLGATMTGPVYDERTRTMTVTALATAKLAVLAAHPDLAWVNYVVVGGLALMVIIIVASVPVQMARRQNYRDYLRSKYYNL